MFGYLSMEPDVNSDIKHIKNDGSVYLPVACVIKIAQRICNAQQKTNAF